MAFYYINVPVTIRKLQSVLCAKGFVKLTLVRLTLSITRGERARILLQPATLRWLPDSEGPLEW